VIGVPLREKAEIHTVPDEENSVFELRFPYRNNLVDSQKKKNTAINIVQL
jgi:hypothetical protein